MTTNNVLPLDQSKRKKRGEPYSLEQLQRELYEAKQERLKKERAEANRQTQRSYKIKN